MVNFVVNLIVLFKYLYYVIEGSKIIGFFFIFSEYLLLSLFNWERESLGEIEKEREMKWERKRWREIDR